jgi:ketosteroid isomerase-like protein
MDVNDRDVVLAFFELLGSGDVETWLGLLADDVVVDTPFAPEGTPTRFEGIAAVSDRFGDARRRMRSLAFLEIEALRTERADRWVVTCRSEGVMGDGRIYQNRYCWLFSVRQGRIVAWTEYFDPQEVMRVRSRR